MSHWDKQQQQQQLSALTYGLSLGFLSVAVLALFVLLFVVCKQRPTEPEDDALLPIKLPARSYPLADVDAATDGFSRRHLLGQGPRGSVYQAVLLATGELVAVKRVHPHLVLLGGINNAGSGSGSGFCSTVKSLSWAHHPNVVPILGYSEGPGERIVITALMGLRSLEFHLHTSPAASSFLDCWPRRIRIAAEAARGIEYLHEVAMPRLVHGSVKPSNVLIDSSFRARVCDYGLAFLGGPAGREEKDDDEGGGPCMAGDVYGLGVVLLELLTGRRSETGMVIQWALHLIRESRMEELLDPRVRAPGRDEMRLLVRMGKVALACVGNSGKNRPSVVQVAAILNSLVAVDDDRSRI